VHTATEKDVDDAVKAARAALEGPWAELSGTERGVLLHKLADLIDAEKETLATVETWDNGLSAPHASLDLSAIATNEFS
jgi:aldehyde dehydrogenase (NAD(P)+)